MCVYTLAIYVLSSKVTGNVFVVEFIPYNCWFARDVTAAMLVVKNF